METKLCTDHNVAVGVARLLRNHGYDVITARDQHMERAGDDEQLLRSSQDERVLVTHNAKHFFMLHDAWRRWSEAWQMSQPHAGILVIPQMEPLTAAREIDSFLQQNLPMSNELYSLQPDGGWIRRL